MPFFPSIRWRWPAMALLVTGLFAGCNGLDTKQRQWIFSPAIEVSEVATLERSDGKTDVWIEHQSRDAGMPVRLHALWSPRPEAGAPLLLYLHGARRTIERDAFRIRQMQSLGFSVLAVDYRGFGRSTDALPSEVGVLEDVKAAWEWLGRSHPDQSRYIFGHSLGGAIAVQLAAAVSDADGLIVEGTFTSIPDVVRTFRWGWLPVSPLITQRFDSARTIAQVKAPVLVVHGSRDRLIVPALGQALFERAQSPKKFVLVEGGTHYSTNAVGQAQYRQALRELFGLSL